MKNKRFLKFAVVGAGGFLVDVIATYTLSRFVAVELARAIAFWIAASSNWWFNRHFTFDQALSRPSVQQWLQFLSASCVGFLPNWGCYWLLMNSGLEQATTSLIPIDSAMWWPYLAMVPGIVLGMGVNFILSDRWVFRLAVMR